jgi:putative transposase
VVFGPTSDAYALDVVWAMDFQFDATADGHNLNIVSMVDENTRESLLNITVRSITTERLLEGIDQTILRRGKPLVLRCDNGPEFISKALKEYCEDEIGINYIPPGQPWKNGFIKSFNNRPRDECLNGNQFNSLLHAQVAIGDWKNENYNRRHSSLDYQTPIEYAHTCSHTHQIPEPACSHGSISTSV